MKKLMIYGASGYTGRMAAARAKDVGLDLVIAGRDEAPLREMATTLGVEYRVFALDDPASADHALADTEVLLNCAGPFVHTAEPLMAACLRMGTHYLDIAAELDSYKLAAKYDSQAVDAGMMLMPGSGGSVAMLGSLAARAVERITAPVSVRIALHVSGAMSRGSAMSASQNLIAQCLMRKGDVLVPRDPAERRDFDFGRGAVSCFPVTLPDLITIARQTGIGDIETYVHVSGSASPEGGIDALPEGPTAHERQDNRYQAAVEVVDADGTTIRMALDTVNGYSFTPLAAVEAARRVLAGEIRAGFHTPVGIFGSGFAETIADTHITLLASTDAPARQGIHSMSILPASADHIGDKLAVVETLYRFAAGIDLRDPDLLSSAFADNAVSDFRPAAAKAGFEYPVLIGRKTIVEALLSSLSRLDTTHSISNPRVTLDADTAHVDVLVEAQHVCRRDAASLYLMKNRYAVVLTRRGTHWEIENLTVDNVWRIGNLGVLAGD